MSATEALTLRKEERLCSKKLIGQLFEGGNNHSIVAFPLRAVFMKTTLAKAPVQMLVSVPKRQFKRAVKRNRVKRQVREAFRNNKTLLEDAKTANEGGGIVIAFIWLDNRLRTTQEVEGKVKSLLQRIKERL